MPPGTLLAGTPARGAAARLRRPAPASPGRSSAPAAHVGHLPPAGAALRAGRGRQVRCGRPGGWARRGAAGWGRRPSAPQLRAEPQAEQQRSAQQTPAQGAAAPAGRPLPRHGRGRPGGLRSAARARRPAGSKDVAPRSRAANYGNSPAGRGAGSDPPPFLRSKETSA